MLIAWPVFGPDVKSTALRADADGKNRGMLSGAEGLNGCPACIDRRSVTEPSFAAATCARQPGRGTQPQFQAALHGVKGWSG